ncbi:hypothetical protein H4R20_003310 [Coemansia guatemalensis]|uniref:Uncharacterized protein n=1 Tax=Coemansia guatemalensis TaxID=2761395 RepID=A0A9W8LT62_9FUNG|nr:hypothetical protein H4R20_003310 [Coemansia guatemalensis]
MTNVLISGVYPNREAAGGEGGSSSNSAYRQAETAAAAINSACPLHAAPGTLEQVLKYSPTREDESMREALKLLTPIRDDFRLADYAQSFNWDKISDEFHRQLKRFDDPLLQLPKRTEYSWYAVVFRSKRKVDCSNSDLFEADKMAYEEAYKSTNGSLLVYWYTGLDDDHNCLATCVWSSRDIARSVNSLPKHKEAARLSADVYVHYNIDRYRISWVPTEQKLNVAPW